MANEPSTLLQRAEKLLAEAEERTRLLEEKGFADIEALDRALDALEKNIETAAKELNNFGDIEGK